MEQPYRLLTVDDSELVSTALSMTLCGAGFEVRAALSGQEALAAIAAQVFDLLIIDIVMPEMDGFALLHRIRFESRCAATPVLMLTSSDEIYDVKRARSLGAVGFLTKPFKEVELIAKARRVLTSRSVAWIDDHHCLFNAAAAEPSERRRVADVLV